MSVRYERPLLFKHEICAHPPALFKFPGIMRAASMVVIADIPQKM